MTSILPEVSSGAASAASMARSAVLQNVTLPPVFVPPFGAASDVASPPDPAFSPPASAFASPEPDQDRAEGLIPPREVVLLVRA
ncbi:hypothetical protein [Streptomyces alboflavus]|uniref:hypothetical protein n=1 Tax=Streptomyces alboflavus TaxID=67267 RepID=UPI0036BBDDD0